MRRRVEHFRIDPTARVTVELRNAQQEKSGRRGASSRGFTRRIGFFLFLFLWAMQHRQVATRCSHLSVLHRPQKKTEKKGDFHYTCAHNPKGPQYVYSYSHVKRSPPSNADFHYYTCVASPPKKIVLSVFFVLFLFLLLCGRCNTGDYTYNTQVLHRPQKKNKKPILRTNPRLEAPLPPFFLRTYVRSSVIPP